VCVRAKEHYGGCWNSNFSFGLNGWNYWNTKSNGIVYSDRS
jgi:hypothetical protein